MTTSEDSTTIPLKRCSKGDNCAHPDGCMQPATFEYFSRCKLTRDGFQSWCRACLRVSNRNWHRDNVERSRERNKQWRDANPEKRRAAHKRRSIAKSDEIREYRKKYHIANADVLRENGRRWVANNPEKQRARTKRWASENPEKIRGYALRRYHRTRSVISTFTAEQWLRCLEWWNNTCAYCGAQQSFWHVLEQEHFEPAMLGGEYTAQNIVPACRACNASKHNSSPIKWIRRKFKANRARQIETRIAEYFEWVNSQE